MTQKPATNVMSKLWSHVLGFPKGGAHHMGEGGWNLIRRLRWPQQHGCCQGHFLCRTDNSVAISTSDTWTRCRCLDAAPRRTPGCQSQWSLTVIMGRKSETKDLLPRLDWSGLAGLGLGPGGSSGYSGSPAPPPVQFVDLNWATGERIGTAKTYFQCSLGPFSPLPR